MESRVKGTFGDRLQDLISDSGKTLREIASEIGVSQASLSNYQNGVGGIANIEALVMIAQYFNVSTDYFLGLSDAPTTDKTAAAAIDYTGLSPQTVAFLHTMHSVLPFGERNMFAKTIDFLIDDANRKPDDNYNSLLWILNFFLRLDASDNEQVYVMDARGDIHPFDRQGGRRGIRSSEISFDGDMGDAVALTAITQKLTLMRQARRQQEKE